MKLSDLVRLGFILVVPCLHAANKSRPNILFIAADDLRPELGCYGQSHIISPHIDRLAARGAVFTRAYCQQAICGPSRASLLTGLRPNSTGVFHNETHFRQKAPHVVTLPQQFKENGYHTQAVGKIFHHAFRLAIPERTFDDPPSWSEPTWVDSPRYYYTTRGVQVAREAYARETGKRGAELDGWTEAFVRGLATEDPDVADNVPFDGRMTDQAIKILREIKQARRSAQSGPSVPFFLAVGYLKPHLPFVAPKKYWDLYDSSKIELAKNDSPPKDVPAVALHTWGELRYYYDMPKEGPLTPEQARRLRHGYYACVSYIDSQIGRLLEELEQLGLRDDTIVVLWGDHGWHLGEHSLWAKTTNFETDTRAPLIISVPGTPTPGARINGLVEFVDIYPTLCELAALPLPAHLEGASFAPLLREPARAWKTAAFSQYPRAGLMGYTMRTDRYRFTLWQPLKDPTEIRAVELYDHQTDSAETVNLAGWPEHAPLVKALTDKLRAGWRPVRAGL